MPKTPHLPQPHSAAWVAQAWISLLVATSATAVGIWALPVDPWVRGFMAMGVLFCLGSAVSLTKTLRDQHEAERLAARIDEARVSKLIQEHDPLRVHG